MSHSERSYKFLNIASAGILLIAFCFIVLFGYLLFIEDNPPLIVNSNPTLDKSSYYAGEVMLVTADLCRNTTAGATGQPTVIKRDTRQRCDALPVVGDNRPKGCSVSKFRYDFRHISYDLYYR